MHNTPHAIGGTAKPRLVEWFRHPDVVGPIALPLIESDCSVVPRKDVEDDFTVPMVTCLALDKARRARPTPLRSASCATTRLSMYALG